ncbi:hypothetical protein [Agrilutibacter solisilvae]|uniref:Uncharacterized protein n=1 Tax=Agrilutibacter solisilvae TaxID=2763317 RepID=A0A975ARK1_9GAMM|nr:hypothetical protein [Lysobacter solisilvae]QSX77109.1 hypothetical protein I8J32_009845 [Lysobacter solisilvae]
MLAKGIAFGIGLAVLDALWGDLDWNGGDIDIDIDRFNRLHPEHHFAGGDRNWRHDPASRDGVPYRDRVNRERHGQQLAGAQARDAFRGDDAGRMRSREQARRSLQQGGFQSPSTSNREARENALAAQLEEANARERAMAVAQEGERAREARMRGDDGAGMPGRDGVGGDRIADRAQEADRQRVLEQERIQQIARERQFDEERRQRREFEERRARENAFEGVRQAELARMQRERGAASQAQRMQGSRGGGRAISRPSRR